MDRHYRAALKKLSYCLRYYRRMRGISQSDFAFKSGISFRNYQRIENGEVLPRVDTLMNISQELSLSVSTLLEIPYHTKALLDEALTSKESEALIGLCNAVSLSDTLDLARLIMKSEKPPSINNGFIFETTGNNSVVEDKFFKYVGVSIENVNLDNHLLDCRAVDVWQYVWTKKLKQFKITNLFVFANRTFAIESYNQVISSAPENARSFGLAFDRTNQFRLEEWIQQRSKNFIKQPF